MSDTKKKNEQSKAIEPSRRDSIQIDEKEIKETSSTDLRATNAIKSIQDALQKGLPLPIGFGQVSASPQEILLMILINFRLGGLLKFKGASGAPNKCIKPVSVVFPHCSDVLLAHVKMFDGSSGTRTLADDDITGHFDDYFEFRDHHDSSLSNTSFERSVRQYIIRLYEELVPRHRGDRKQPARRYPATVGDRVLLSRQRSLSVVKHLCQTSILIGRHHGVSNHHV